MPLPRISSHCQGLPIAAASMSTSIDGSVKGKCEARKRIFTSSTSKKALQNSSRHHLRWPRCVSSSITSASIWWNIGVCVASLSMR